MFTLFPAHNTTFLKNLDHRRLKSSDQMTSVPIAKFAENGDRRITFDGEMREPHEVMTHQHRGTGKSIVVGSRSDFTSSSLAFIHTSSSSC